MKNINTIIILCVAGLVLFWMTNSATLQNNYVIGRNRFNEAGLRKPRILRNIQSFFTLADDPNPYTALDDLLSTDLQNMRVAFLLGSPTRDSKESIPFYEELNNAIRTSNKARFEQVIDKYAIDFVVYDPQPYDADKRKIEQTKKMLVDSDIMSLYKKWDSFAIYDTERPVKTQAYLAITSTLPNIGPAETDKASVHSYGDVGYYVSDDTRAYDEYFPFINLLTNTTLSNAEWQLQDDGKYLYFSRSLNAYASSYNLSKNKTQEQIVFSNGDKLAVDEDLVKTMIHKNALIAYFNKQTIAQLSTAKVPVKNCGWVKGSVTWSKKGGELAVTSKQLGVGCFSFDTAGLKGNQSYLVQITTEHTDGSPLRVEVENLNTRASVASTSLETSPAYISLSPHTEQPVRYRFHFRNESDQNFSSSNILKAITIYAFPYDEVESIVLSSKTSAISRARTTVPNETRSFGSYEYIYTTDNLSSPYTTLAFMQPHIQTWGAYIVPASERASLLTYIAPYLRGKRLDKPMLVNSWANGWTISAQSPTTIVILNWPRYVFIVLAVLFCTVVAVYYVMKVVSYLIRSLLRNI